jgi:hypothetical protein
MNSRRHFHLPGNRIPHATLAGSQRGIRLSAKSDLMPLHRARKVKCNRLPGQEKVCAQSIQFLSFLFSYCGRHPQCQVNLPSVVPEPVITHYLTGITALFVQELPLHVCVSRFGALPTYAHFTTYTTDITYSKQQLKRSVVRISVADPGISILPTQGMFRRS